MSAYMTLVTPMLDEECLVAAIVDQGFCEANIVRSEHPVLLRGWQRGRQANVVLPREHTVDAYNDIGFLRGPTGYTAILSNDNAQFGSEWLSRVSARYRVHWSAKLARITAEERQQLEEERQRVVAGNTRGRDDSHGPRKADVLNVRVNLARTLARSAANGPGERFVVWVQGCPLACPGCWNPDTWPFERRELRSIEELATNILATEGIEGVTFTGGEPFAQAGALADLAKLVRAAGLSVFVFTGYDLDELTRPEHCALLKVSDVVYGAARRTSVFTS
jgi:hypothetical protein